MVGDPIHYAIGGWDAAVGQAIVFRGLPSSSTMRRRQTTIVCATAGLLLALQNITAEVLILDDVG
jgi:hypothetical protein